MQGISDAQTIITTFLQDSGPINQATVNGFISGFIGLKSPNDDSGNPLGLPEFTDQLLGAFQSKFTESVTALEGEKFKLFKELGKALKTTLKESGVDTTNTGAADDGAAMENPADATTGD